jgi:hypothetical protein
MAEGSQHKPPSLVFYLVRLHSCISVQPLVHFFCVLFRLDVLSCIEILSGHGIWIHCDFGWLSCVTKLGQ